MKRKIPKTMVKKFARIRKEDKIDFAHHIFAKISSITLNRIEKTLTKLDLMLYGDIIELDLRDKIVKSEFGQCCIEYLEDIKRELIEGKYI